MQPLALTVLTTRYAPRGADRVEILPPRQADRDAAHAQQEEGDASGWAAWREQRMPMRRPPPAMPAGFVAQYLAQRDPGTQAHIEDWRGARGAYARADRLSASGARSVSIIL